MAKFPKEPMSATPPESESDSEPERIPRDSIPAPDSIANESVLANLSTGDNIWKQGEDIVNRFRDAAADFSEKVRDSLTMAEVIRQISKGYSIKFIALIGLTGAGKSSVIKSLTGMDVYVGHGISAGTTSFGMFPAIIEDQCYVFVDTPGFNDADEGRTDVSVFLEILTWFHSMSTYCDLTGVLYVHDITSPRFSASAKTNLAFFQALCGKEFFQNVTIVTTMWRKLVPDAIEGTEDTQTELMEGPWKEMIEGHARVFEHRQGVIESKRPPTEPEKVKNLRDQRMEAHRELVEMMAYYQTSKTITPEIQHELRDKTGLLNTKAGMILLKASGFPPTPVQMGIDATSSSTIHVVHHVESPTAVTPPGANLSTQNNQAKKEGWWQNLVEAVSSFVWRK